MEHTINEDGSFHGRGIKRRNEYIYHLGNSTFENMPKAVLAAVAVSLASCGGDRLNEAHATIVQEWQSLFDNGIVPQDPKKYLSKG